jgi:pyruvate formate lyase activating enzyme
VAQAALAAGARSIAFTYNEPMLCPEFIKDVIPEARAAGLRVILKTNGFFDEDKFREVAMLVDAVNLDVKGDQAAYREVCGVEVGADPESWVVMRNLGAAALLCWAEVSIPVLPERVTSLGTVLAAMAHEVAAGTPIHLLRVMPSWRMRNRRPTEFSELEMAAGMARKHFRNVYIEGVDQDTRCCREIVIKRDWSRLVKNDLHGGKCPRCGSAIPGVWE